MEAPLGLTGRERRVATDDDPADGGKAPMGTKDSMAVVGWVAIFGFLTLVGLLTGL